MLRRRYVKAAPTYLPFRLLFRRSNLENSLHAGASPVKETWPYLYSDPLSSSEDEVNRYVVEGELAFAVGLVSVPRLDAHVQLCRTRDTLQPKKRERLRIG